VTVDADVERLMAALGRWIQIALSDETARVTGEWMGARRDWPRAEREAAWERDKLGMLGVATRRTIRRAREAFPPHVGDMVAKSLEYAGEAVITEYVTGVASLGMPLGPWTCRCAPPRHIRGIARCEWNAEHGWRPKPVAGQG
jgi:hypothetical protein